MAGIDKTYVSTWKEWKELHDWAIDRVANFKNGSLRHLKQFMFNLDMTEEEFNERANCIRQRYYHGDKNAIIHIPFWSTPEYLDVWLARNCPLSIVRNTLITQYGESWLSAIDSGNSDYNSIREKGVGKDFVYKVLEEPKFHHIHRFKYKDRQYKTCTYKANKNTEWFVDLKTPVGSDDLYCDDFDNWVSWRDAVPMMSSSKIIKGKTPTIKSIIRMIKHWDVPNGTIVTVGNKWFDITWRIMILKKEKSNK